MHEIAQCNICGGKTFGAGPNGRMSLNGGPPRCCTCQSLERHRTFRSVFLRLDRKVLATFKALQFSSDRAVDKSWFRSYELSEFDGKRSLDVQSIAKPDGIYDLVICNHVLEHVADDITALRELARITSPRGFVFLTVPDPVNKAHTRDWGYPDERQHGHYRMYGRDIQEKFMMGIPRCPVLSHRACDPVTGVEDLIYLIFKAKEPALSVAGRLNNAEFLQPGLAA